MRILQKSSVSRSAYSRGNSGGCTKTEMLPFGRGASHFLSTPSDFLEKLQFLSENRWFWSLHFRRNLGRCTKTEMLPGTPYLPLLPVVPTEVKPDRLAQLWRRARRQGL